jgi:beta-galactosidase
MSLAASGARVIVLEQPTPLHRLATPTDLEPTLHVGRIAFAENLDHPVLAGLDQPDFFCWSGDHVCYRNVYKKASTGAKSLVQCDMELSCSAVAECPVNEGLLLLCQLVVGEKLDSDPVAQRLFDNLLNYAADYKVVRKSTAVAMDENSPPAKMLARSGLKHDKAGDVLSAVSDGQHEIVVAAASPANLRALAGGSEKLKAFTDRGGWLVLWGLTPEGLADFNKIVGVNHLLRPFEMERVTLPAVRDPVMSGLTMRDVVMESGEKIMSHIGDKFLANDIFTCVVDFDDIAPFCDIPGPEHWNQAGAKPGYDHWPRNMVNGFVTADSWKYVFSILIGKGEPTKWTMKLPREEEILEFSIALNTIYHKVTKINLLFDDDPKPVTLVTRPINDRQDFPIAPRKARAITIELAEWEKSGAQEVIGVDNLWIRVKRPADFAQKVRPLLNIGALVKYPVGKGGVILNQLQIMPTETVPINAQKKQTIVSTILRNLGATFAGGRTLATGDLKLTPVPFEDQCNQYLTRDRGWFDPQRDLGHLPAGEQKLAGVTFVLRDFRTSPVPSCIMIAGPGVKGTMPKEFRGLKVGRKADALFFLHAFKRTGDWRPSKKDDAPPVVFKYVVHYSDGKSADVPVLYGDGADHWISKDPKGLKSAAVAWAGRFPGDDSGDQAVVYSMPWTNPRPDVEITTIDLTYDQNVGGRYGVPAWLGLTAATAVK